MGSVNFVGKGRSIVKYRETTVISAKTAAPIEMPFGLRTRVGPRNHVLDGGPDSPWEGAIFRGKWHPIVKYRGHCAVPCVKTAALIEMPFGLWARMGPRNRVRWGPAVLRDVAMATNFGVQFAITGFVGCNFGYMIAV